MPSMMTATDIIEQLEQIDVQIVKLLEERTRLCAGRGLDADEEANILSLWLEEAAEQGLDEAKVEKIGKLVILLCRGGVEE